MLRQQCQCRITKARKKENTKQKSKESFSFGLSFFRACVILSWRSLPRLFILISPARIGRCLVDPARAALLFQTAAGLRPVGHQTTDDALEEEQNRVVRMRGAGGSELLEVQGEFVVGGTVQHSVTLSGCGPNGIQRHAGVNGGDSVAVLAQSDERLSK
jgi:hypothetical protein